MHTTDLFMQRCLQLAALGIGKVAPNPMVGAVLVHNGRIIGEGYHQQYGQAHAEVNCINSVEPDNRHLINKADLYVSLEPCAHFGKTPPCADLIIRQGIKRVVVGCRDPFIEVDGKGIEKLRAAGVAVEMSPQENEFIVLNKRFFTFHTKKRPYLILKWAQSADGFIAGNNTAERTFISNNYSNRLVHKWRSEEAGILVGTNTAKLDNPSLTTRLWKGNNPVRLAIDKKNELRQNSLLLNGECETIVFGFYKNEESGNISYTKLDPNLSFLTQIMNTLYAKAVTSVLVEGGAKTLQSFIDEGLWDEARIITNQSLYLHDGVQAPKLQHASLLQTELLAGDLISILQRNG